MTWFINCKSLEGDILRPMQKPLTLFPTLLSRLLSFSENRTFNGSTMAGVMHICMSFVPFPLSLLILKPTTHLILKTWSAILHAGYNASMDTVGRQKPSSQSRWRFSHQIVRTYDNLILHCCLITGWVEVRDDYMFIAQCLEQDCLQKRTHTHVHPES